VRGPGNSRELAVTCFDEYDVNKCAIAARTLRAGECSRRREALQLIDQLQCLMAALEEKG